MSRVNVTTTWPKTESFKSSLAKKYAMAATGLFLCLFLAGHLAGNLQLFTAASDGGGNSMSTPSS